MARFYFNLESKGGLTVRDEQGDECTLDEAIQHAKAVAAELARKGNCDGERLSVLAECGTVIFEIAVSTAGAHPTQNEMPLPSQ